ncbi:MAG TPA: tRNA 2-thiouridine(34) synthase MnmA [Acidimicrobiales bacterium]|nr:tRNA 2-thiouridine(34) synthase MnmA [Acidimicrobiales bacterium]
MSLRVLVAMSGGVDSSVAALLLSAQGHDVVGATMKLWGESVDSGCCSVADVEDARRVAQQLGVPHHVFNFTAEFERAVVGSYVTAHEEGYTPNPCIACNQHLKFGSFLRRACLLGFDAMATGHHARISRREPGTGQRLRRGRDLAKDQSYVLYMLGPDELAHLLLPVGELTKDEVRALAAEAGLRTAAKPDSQDVCFISRSAGREGFLRSRISVGPGRFVDSAGRDMGATDALELLTVGQRRGLGLAAPLTRPCRQYVTHVDFTSRTASVGPLAELLVNSVEVVSLRWPCGPLPPGSRVEAQFSAHGRPVRCRWEGSRKAGVIHLDEPARRVAPGQAVVLYKPAAEGGDVVVGGGTAA